MGTSQLSVVVTWAVVSSVRVQPSLVLTVAVVDIFLILGGRFLRVFLMELVDEIG